MDSKFYVSLKAARLLNEKGYSKKRDFLTPVYKENGYLYWSNHEDLSDNILAITKAEAIDWLESKGILISSHPVTILCDDGTTKTHWSCHIVQKDGTWNTTNDLPTRLEAEEAAIIKACKLLENGN